MAIYIHKRLDKAFIKFGIGDIELCSAAAEIMRGEYEADLGGGVKKKRIRVNAGKSGGARSIVFFKKESNLFFYDGWLKDGSKKGTKEIEEDELAVYRKLAGAYLKADRKVIDKLKASGTFREVNDSENETS